MFVLSKLHIMAQPGHDIYEYFNAKRMGPPYGESLCVCVHGCVGVVVITTVLQLMNSSSNSSISNDVSYRKCPGFDTIYSKLFYIRYDISIFR